MIVVNLFGAPGSGKSTGAAYIFAKLKLAGINAELVTEFAKDKVYERSEAVFENQLYILGKQSFRLSRLEKEVDVVVTDSPLLLSIYYNERTNADDDYKGEFACIAHHHHRRYTNYNYFINRAKAYNPRGRFQTEEEADKIAEEQKTMYINMLILNGEDIGQVPGSIEGYNSIALDVLGRLNNHGNV